MTLYFFKEKAVVVVRDRKGSNSRKSLKFIEALIRDGFHQCSKSAYYSRRRKLRGNPPA